MKEVRPADTNAQTLELLLHKNEIDYNKNVIYNT
jgi:hypothetical protein